MALRRTIFFTGATPAAAAGPVTVLPAVASSYATAFAAGARPTALFADKPTVVPVHGAYADPSDGNGVNQRLRHEGRPARAAADPLRGLPTDSAAPNAVAARKDIPSRYLVVEQDRALAPGLQRYTATRVGARVEPVSASHSVSVSRPGAVTRLIEEAVHSTR